MKKNKLLLCFVTISIVFQVSCKNNNFDSQVKEFSQRLLSIKKETLKKGQFKLSSKKDWDFMIIVKPFFISEALFDELGFEVSSINDLQIKMEQESFQKYRFKSNLVLLFLKNDKVVFEKKLDEGLFRLPYSELPNYGYIYVKKESPIFHFKKYQDDIVLFGSDIRSQEIFEEPTLEEFNKSILEKFKGKGTKIDFKNMISYPDQSSPKQLIKSFLKAQEQKDLKVMQSIIYPSENAKIFINDEAHIWNDVKYIGVEKYSKQHIPGSIATHVVTIIHRSKWNGTIEDIPYFYFIRKKKKKWEIVSWTIGLRYD